MINGMVYLGRMLKVSLVIEEPIASLLKRKARERGLQVEEYLLTILGNEMNPKERVEVYVKLHEKFLREAEGYYRKEDLAQAGEKYWGAVTALLNAIGEKEGLPHYTHRDLVEIIEYLADKLKEPEIAGDFAHAERLHANYYHNFIRKITFEHHREHVIRLMKKLREYLKTS